jgi:hypothetical protein
MPGSLGQESQQSDNRHPAENTRQSSTVSPSADRDRVMVLSGAEIVVASCSTQPFLIFRRVPALTSRRSSGYPYSSLKNKLLTGQQGHADA